MGVSIPNKKLMYQSMQIYICSVFLYWVFKYIKECILLFL